MTGAGTNTYIVDDEHDSLAVIDPGPNDPRHLHAILREAEPLGAIRSILVTHRHSDHLPAAFPLAERTGAPVGGHPDLPGVQERLCEGVDHAIGTTHLQVLHTPGHTDDSVCFWEDRQRALFTGDIIAGAGTVIVDDSPGGLAQYMASLVRLEQLLEAGDGMLYPGHGPSTAEGLAKVREYLAHRRGRESGIVGLLAESANDGCSVEEIVSTLYTETPAGLRGMAARNVTAHLEKLRDEGRAVQTRTGWRLMQEAH